MSETTAISAAELKELLVRAGDLVCGARDELCALDAAAGDGDLGATLATGFAHGREALEQAGEDEDAGALLRRLGLELARKAPSTIGALLASAFLCAGKELDGRSELGADEIAALLQAAAAGVSERGGATPGQRTIVDAMVAAADAADAARGGGIGATLQAGAAGARAGAEATAAMEPQHGRAGWIADRARGSQDAGAAAWAVFVGGLDQAWQATRPPARDQTLAARADT